jgi:hypothetical protein
MICFSVKKYPNTHFPKQKTQNAIIFLVTDMTNHPKNVVMVMVMVNIISHFKIGWFFVPVPAQLLVLERVWIIFWLYLYKSSMTTTWKRI